MPVISKMEKDLVKMRFFFVTNFYYLCYMEIEIQNRLSTGLVLGWALYNIDDEYDYGEFILYLLFISVHVRWIHELKL